MQKPYRLRKNSQFQYVYRRGKSFANPTLALLYVRSGRMLVGFSISKKIGKSVQRNKLKRRLREIFRGQIPKLHSGQYVVTARHGASGASYDELQSALLGLLRRAKLYKPGQL